MMPEESKKPKKKLPVKKEKPKPSDDETKMDVSPDNTEDAHLLPGPSTAADQATGGSPLETVDPTEYEKSPGKEGRNVTSSSPFSLEKVKSFFQRKSDSPIKKKESKEEKDTRKPESELLTKQQSEGQNLEVTKSIDQGMKKLSPFKDDDPSKVKKPPSKVVSETTPTKSMWPSSNTRSKTEVKSRELSKQTVKAEKKEKHSQQIPAPVSGPSSTGSRPKVPQPKQGRSKQITKAETALPPGVSTRARPKVPQPKQERSEQISEAEKKERLARQSPASVPGPSSTGARPKVPQPKQAKTSSKGVKHEAEDVKRKEAQKPEGNQPLSKEKKGLMSLLPSPFHKKKPASEVKPAEVKPSVKKRDPHRTYLMRHIKVDGTEECGFSSDLASESSSGVPTESSSIDTLSGASLIPEEPNLNQPSSTEPQASSNEPEQMLVSTRPKRKDKTQDQKKPDESPI